MIQTLTTCILFTFVLYTTAEEIGQRCTLKNDVLGTCRDIRNCKSAQDDLRKQIKPVLCEFDGNVPLVCCQNVSTVLQSGTTIRKSEKKCKEYLALRTPYEVSHFIGGGGVDAEPKDFPHMAILGYNRDNGTVVYKCGGSLISDQFVLTAAHCLELRTMGEVSTVRIGDLDTASGVDDADPQDFKVIERIPHPDYDFKQFYHDLALIKLDRKVHITEYVKPACLQTDLKLENNYSTATGWGALYFGGDMHNILQKLNISSLSKEKCLPTYRPQPKLKKGFDDDLQICGGNLQRSVDTCYGHSGGPLQLQIQFNPPVHRVVGMTSVSVECNLVPGIYTRVSKYISWIENVVWPS